MSSTNQNTRNGDGNGLWLALAILATVFMGAFHLATTYLVRENPVDMRTISTIFNCVLGVLLLADFVMMAQFRLETGRLQPIALITTGAAFVVAVINVYVHVNMNVVNYATFDMITTCAHPILLLVLIIFHPKGELVANGPYG